MKKRELISIEEQLYAKGIWKRPILADGYKKHKGIRIISEDGTTWRTKIVDGETGKDIPYIYKAELIGKVGELWDVVLYGHKCMLDVTIGKYKIKRTKV
jgi:hypothetical protein